MQQIKQVTAFLESYVPGSLAELRQRHPSLAAYFEPGSWDVLGGSDSSDADGSTDDDGEAAELDAVRLMLSSLDEVADRELTRVAAKIRAARRLELTGAIAGLLASSGVVGAALLQRHLVAALLGAASFVSLAAPLVVAFLKSGDFGPRTVAENFAALADMSIKAQHLLEEVQRPQHLRRGKKSNLALLHEADDFALGLRSILVTISGRDPLKGARV